MRTPRPVATINVAQVDPDVIAITQINRTGSNVVEINMAQLESMYKHFLKPKPQDMTEEPDFQKFMAEMDQAFGDVDVL